MGQSKNSTKTRQGKHLSREDRIRIEVLYNNLHSRT